MKIKDTFRTKRLNIRIRYIQFGWLKYLVAICFINLVFSQSNCSRYNDISKKELGIVSNDLFSIQRSFEEYIKTAYPENYKSPNKNIRVRNGLVVIDATAKNDAKLLLSELEALGLQKGKTYGLKVSGWLPIEVIPKLETCANLKFIRPSYAKTKL